MRSVNMHSYLRLAILLPTFACATARGDPPVARGPTSPVMLRSGGRWQIVHGHSS
jgi:hypothetical protein